MDLSNLKAQNTIDIQLVHPVSGEPIEGGMVTCYAPHTPQYRTIAIQVARKYKQGAANWTDMSDEELSDLISKTDEAGAELLEKVIIEHDFRLNGKKVKNKSDILGNASYFWIVQQIQEKINEAQVFIGA